MGPRPRIPIYAYLLLFVNSKIQSHRVQMTLAVSGAVQQDQDG
jgi:hypothetical protein